MNQNAGNALLSFFLSLPFFGATQLALAQLAFLEDEFPEDPASDSEQIEISEIPQSSNPKEKRSGKSQRESAGSRGTLGDLHLGLDVSDHNPSFELRLTRGIKSWVALQQSLNYQRGSQTDSAFTSFRSIGMGLRLQARVGANSQFFATALPSLHQMIREGGENKDAILSSLEASTGWEWSLIPMAQLRIFWNDRLVPQQEQALWLSKQGHSRASGRFVAQFSLAFLSL